MNIQISANTRILEYQIIQELMPVHPPEFQDLIHNVLPRVTIHWTSMVIQEDHVRLIQLKMDQILGYQVMKRLLPLCRNWPMKRRMCKCLVRKRTT